jgi:RNA-directed DNA polymerase
MDKVASEETLRAAFWRVRRNKGAAGIDHVTVKQYEKRLAENLGQLAAKLRSGTYRPQAIRRQWIEKPSTWTRWTTRWRRTASGWFATPPIW